jgi:hexosaminidase
VRVMRHAAMLMSTAALIGAALAGPASAATSNGPPDPIIPKPVSFTPGSGHFTLSPTSRIVANSSPAAAIARDLADQLRPATGYALPVTNRAPRSGDITLDIGRPPAIKHDRTGEAYVLTITGSGVRLEAPTPHGLFDGIQSIRQLLGPWIAAHSRQPGPWTMPAATVVDYPRYQYRGYMLDIARHFEPPSVVERLIDEVSAYKIDVFHLHLSDDQGFRIVINGFPRLTAIGGQGSVGTGGRTMDPGGYWTQAQYRAVVAYAAAHFITVIPEVDSPGHDNAIIMSEYGDTSNPRLDGHPQSINCSVSNPPQWNYTEDVGYSALCPESPDTWRIMTAIIDQLSAMTPGPYYDLGGDEVPNTLLSQTRYAAFLNREFGIVGTAHKTVMGWADIAGPDVTPPAGSVAEYWQPAAGNDPNAVTGREAVAKHLKVVMAPANHAYLDQKDIVDGAKVVPPTLGLHWACPTGCDVDAFYNWDPGHLVTGVTDADGVIGVEATLFGETVVNRSNDEYMTFPRLLATAELGWSPYVVRQATSPAYADFLARLAGQGARLMAGGVNFYPSTEVPWRLAAEPVGAHGRRIRGTIARLAAPGVPPDAITATVSWGDGTTSRATIAGRGPTDVEVNSLYRVSATHTYRTRGSHTATLTVRAPGKATVTLRFVIGG